jgi:DNA-binding transcriptional ArsR family regulator
MDSRDSAKRDFKDRLYAEFARIGKAVANPHRLEILEVLAQGERSVESVATETGLSVANASNHLQQLRQAQLVLARRDGVYIFYRLAGAEVVALVVALRHVAEQHLAEVDRVVRDFLGERDGFEAVAPDELAERLTSGEVVLLDVRPEQEFAAGHIAGARSMPVSDLCLYADEAVAVLRANGRAARRLTDGFPEWSLAGRPIATAPPK